MNGEILIGIGVLCAFFLVLAMLEKSVGDDDAKAQEENARVGRFVDAFLEAIKQGKEPTWQQLKQLAVAHEVDNEHIPDIMQQLVKDVATGKLLASPGALDAVRRYQTAHESELLIAAIPDRIVLPTVQTLEKLGAEQGTMVPVLEEMIRLEHALEQALEEKEALAGQLEKAGPSATTLLFAWLFVFAALGLGVAIYFDVVHIAVGPADDRVELVGDRAAAASSPAAATEAGGANVAGVVADDSQSYVARISEQDHTNGSGVRLTTAAQVIAQDRANVHRLGARDPEDEVDRVWTSVSERTRLRKMLGAADLDAAVEQAILTGTPRVRVRWTADSAAVEVLE